VQKRISTPPVTLAGMNIPAKEQGKNILAEAGIHCIKRKGNIKDTVDSGIRLSVR
jgi:hypothetical protein